MRTRIIIVKIHPTKVDLDCGLLFFLRIADPSNIGEGLVLTTKGIEFSQSLDMFPADL